MLLHSRHFGLGHAIGFDLGDLRQQRLLNLGMCGARRAARGVSTPKQDKYLPGYLDRAQIGLLFQSAELKAQEGRFGDVRNAAILELFYSTGMRLSELRGINRTDIDLLSQQVKVRGKGRKERIIPIGDHAQLALRNYESKRDELLRAIGPTGDRTAFFLSNRGKRISVRAIQNAVKGFLDKIDENLQKAMA